MHRACRSVKWDNRARVLISEGKKMTMQPGDVVLLETPGGGGYGPV